MTERFAGRVALLTGAARGLGRAAALRLLAGGAAVAVNVRRPEQAQAVLEEMTAVAGSGAAERLLVVAGDVSIASDVRAIVERTLERFGRLDILVNNAAVALTTRFEQIAEAEWRRVMDVNVTGAFLCTRAVVGPMKAHGYGRIVNVSSTAGKNVSTLGGAHYTASKAALLGLTRATASELGRYGITVNAICPGLIDTELTRESSTPEQRAAYAQTFPIPRLGTPLEVADLICFLASDEAGYITGAALDINGGGLMV
ncbi:MAG TPA: SDR family NAD(P)-dependent oxidoreductase [Thermoanaerobaculia bacterium]|nr:SDR family NAD(P)-dependent oxidoreductase [Thermoanaerobaculia bacterium]